MDAESITMMLNAWILAFRKLFEDIGLDRVIRKRLRKALVFKYDSLNQNFSMRNHSSSVKIAKKNAPYGAPQRAVCGFEAVFRLTHTVNQAVIHHDQYSTAGEHGTRELKVSEEIFGSNFLNGRESSITTGIFWYCGIMTLQKESRIPPMCGKGNTL